MADSQYIVVRSYNLNDFMREVNYKMELGYNPIGGMHTVGSFNDLIYFQSMVRKD